MREPPPLFRHRSEKTQAVLGGVVPFVFGVVVGLVLGASAGAYWALAILAALGAVLAGFEHQDGWGGADRGLVGGGIYAIGLLLAHWVSGAHAKVSLGSFPPLLIIVSAIIGMLLGALGGRIGRSLWPRNPADQTAESDAPPPLAELPAAGSSSQTPADQAGGERPPPPARQPPSRGQLVPAPGRSAGRERPLAAARRSAGRERHAAAAGRLSGRERLATALGRAARAAGRGAQPQSL